MNDMFDMNEKDRINRVIELEIKLKKLKENIDSYKKNFDAYKLKLSETITIFEKENKNSKLRKGKRKFNKLIDSIKTEFYINKNNFDYTLVHAGNFIRVMNNKICCKKDNASDEYNIYFDFSNERYADDYTKITNQRYKPIKSMTEVQGRELLLVLNENRRLEQNSKQLIMNIISIESEVNEIYMEKNYNGDDHVGKLINEIGCLRDEISQLSEDIKSNNINSSDIVLLNKKYKECEQQLLEKENYIKQYIIRTEFEYHDKTKFTDDEGSRYMDVFTGLMSGFNHGTLVNTQPHAVLARPVNSVIITSEVFL
ncbi:hypothetical protein ABQD47_19810 [Providencia rettgeri]